MFKMSAFSVDTGSQMTLPPIINGVTHSALFQSTPQSDDTVAARRCHGHWSDTHAAAWL